MSVSQLIRENSEGARATEYYQFLKPILDSVREEMREEWFRTKPAQANAREHMWRALHALDDVENKIINIINTGKMAQIMLQRGDNG